MQEIKDTTLGSDARSVVQRVRSHAIRGLPLLVVLSGPSHAGKSTLAREINKVGDNFRIISPDQIRTQLSVSFGVPEYEAKVWNIYESIKRKALENGHNVILDACHMSEQARWHSLQGKNSKFRKICIVFDLPLQTIRERCIREKRLPLSEAERMWEAFQKSKPTQRGLERLGFDEVYFIYEG